MLFVNIKKMGKKTKSQASVRLATIISFTIGVMLASTSVGYADGSSGGSDGGTNTNKITKEPVEFERGKRVPIDPRTFEGIYAKIKPRLDVIEAKIPGLGIQLERVLTSKSWYVTDQVFTPRNENEEQPILQNRTYVLLSGPKVKEMSQNQLVKAWFHELVRGHIQDLEPEVYQNMAFRKMTQAEIDQRVENLTVVLFNEFGARDVNLANQISLAMGTIRFPRGAASEYPHARYLSRSQIEEPHVECRTKELFLSVCRANGLTADSPEIRAVKKCLRSSLSEDFRCLMPSLADSILASLNANKPEANRSCSYISRWKDMGYPNGREEFYVLNNDPAMNTYGDRLVASDQLSHFGWELSAAVIGESAIPSYNAAGDRLEQYGDSLRIGMAARACIKDFDTDAFTDRVMNLGTDPNATDVGSAINSLDEALKQLSSPAIGSCAK